MSTSSTEGGQEQSNGSSAGQGQESAGNGQQGGQESATGQQSGQSGSGAQFDPSTVQDPALRSYLEKVQRDAQDARTEAARYRTERNALQQQHETAEQRAQREQTEREEQSNQDRTERERLERENRELRASVKVQAAAVAARAFNPDRVAEMLAGQVTLNDKGEPTNLQDLLDGLKQSDPYMFKRATGEAGHGREGAETPDNHPNSILRRALRGQG